MELSDFMTMVMLAVRHECHRRGLACGVSNDNNKVLSFTVGIIPAGKERIEGNTFTFRLEE